MSHSFEIAHAGDRIIITVPTHSGQFERWALKRGERSDLYDSAKVASYVLPASLEDQARERVRTLLGHELEEYVDRSGG